MKQVVTSNCSIHKVTGRRIRSSRLAWAVMRRDLASSSVLCCRNKTLTKSNLREPWVCPTLPRHSPPLRDSKARTQGRNLERSQSRDHAETLLPDVLPRPVSLPFLYAPVLPAQDWHCPQRSDPSLQQLETRKCPPPSTDMLTGRAARQFLQ